LLEGVDLKNFRFRAYDNIAKVKMEPYMSFDKTLLQLNIKSHAKLIIEIKEDGEEFEEYNPDLLKLRVINFDPNENYDFKKLESLKTQDLEVNRREHTVGDLEDMVSELYGIPKDNLILMLRHVQFNSQPKSEIYNMAWRKPKKILDAAKVDHGTIIYVEEGDIKAKIETH